jgi:hypothetical protein
LSCNGFYLLTWPLGRPPRWSPLSKPKRLLPDTGKYLRDVNAARYPWHPIEAAVHASLGQGSTLRDDEPVDVFACASTIGNLLRFIRSEDKTFRMLAEFIDGTLFLIRRENSPTELIPNVKGFGHAFPEAYTTWDADVKGSVSHQRLIRYQFGKLALLVRFEVDGHLLPNSAKPDTKSAALSASRTMSSDQTLIAALDNTSISPIIPDIQGKKLHVREGGESQLQENAFDLKTRSVWKRSEDTLSQELPRLWISQIPKFILAYHEGGVFNDIQIRDVSKEVTDWESEKKSELSKLAALLHLIVSRVQELPSDKLEICRKDMGTLDLREQLPGVSDALSPAMKAMWLDRNTSKESSHDSVEHGPESGDEVGLEWNEGEEDKEDFTACSNSCGYCGKCSY